MSVNKKKINIYITKNKLSTYNYYLLKYIYSKLKNNKLINIVIISSDYSGKFVFKDNSTFYKKIIWINPKKLYNWREINLECPDILFQSGWTTKAFQHFSNISKKINKKCKIVLTTDNSLQKNNIRQFFGKFLFKFYYKFFFDYSWVPGLAAKKLMINFGFEKNKIFTGLYVSLFNIYKNKTKPIKRKKQFLFVGQFIKRKNIEKLIEAFKKSNLHKKKWKLILVGEGNVNLNKHIIRNINILPFQSPAKLSILYNQSLFFILPSKIDHWGLVMHEACLSGCYILCSNQVHSKYEFAKKKNSIVFNPNSVSDIKNSLISASNLSYNQLNQGNKKSESLGKKFNYEYSYSQFIKILNSCIGKKIIL